MGYKGDLVAAGGFNGELVCYSLKGEGALIYAERITNRCGACPCVHRVSWLGVRRGRF